MLYTLVEQVSVFQICVPEKQFHLDRRNWTEWSGRFQLLVDELAKWLYLSGPAQKFFSFGPVGPSSPPSSSGSLSRRSAKEFLSLLGRAARSLLSSVLKSYWIEGPHCLMYCNHGGSSKPLSTLPLAPRYSIDTIWYAVLTSRQNLLLAVSFRIPTPRVESPCRLSPSWAYAEWPCFDEYTTGWLREMNSRSPGFSHCPLLCSPK